MTNFADNITSQLIAAGLSRATLVSSSSDGSSFGDTEVIFKLDALLLRFVRDRGQIFLDIASSAAPAEFHQYCDVEVAMGWRTIDQILARREPEAIGAVLTALQT